MIFGHLCEMHVAVHDGTKIMLCFEVPLNYFCLDFHSDVLLLYL